jgi:hypothetical protein
MTVALTITAADGAQTTINMADPAVNPAAPASLAFQFEPARGGMFQSNAGTTSAVANGDVIGYLPDFGTGGLHLTSAADDTSRPTLQGVGVHPYINFDGVNDGLRHLAPSGAYAAGAASWFIALRSNANATDACLMGDAATTPLYAILANHTAASSASMKVRNDANTLLLDGVSALMANVFNGADHVFGIIDDGSGVTPYLDGVAGSRVAYTRSGTLTMSTFNLGALFRASASNWWAGRVYGAMGANRVFTAAEITSANGYLTKLYTP